MIQIVDKIDLNALFAELSDLEAGGTCFFVGTVRNHSKGHQVTELFFECYDEMALAEMEKIRQTAIEKWGLKRALLVHAVGAMRIGEPIVVVGAAAAHRKEAFEACRFLIDELKRTVPIWKKEFYLDAETWVQQTP